MVQRVQGRRGSTMALETSGLRRNREESITASTDFLARRRVHDVGAAMRFDWTRRSKPWHKEGTTGSVRRSIEAVTEGPEGQAPGLHFTSAASPTAYRNPVLSRGRSAAAAPARWCDRGGRRAPSSIPRPQSAVKASDALALPSWAKIRALNPARCDNMARRPAHIEPNTTERNIYFYRLNVGVIRAGHHLTFPVQAVLDHLEGLDYADRLVASDREDGPVSFSIVDHAAAQGRMRLAHIRPRGSTAD
jgi:hypothetical protein